MIHEEVSRGWRDRLSSALDRAENIYLKLLRAIILLIATLMIGYAAWLAATSLYKISRSPDSVVEQQASVAADEITDAEMPQVTEKTAGSQEPTATPEQRQFYADFVNGYFDLYRTRFEPYRQSEDKQLTRDEFDDSFVGSQHRLQAVATGELDFASDRADLEKMAVVMTEAAARPKTVERLQKYKTAKKVLVARQVQKTRTEYRRGWDSYSTNCADWFYSPVGCPVQRSVQVPYTDTVYAMELPEGTQSHTQIFRAFQDRYLQLLQERRDTNARNAQAERNNILAGQVEGGISLMTALQVAAAFLVLMFFFLLIAIERHQRRMSQRMDMAEVQV